MTVLPEIARQEIPETVPSVPITEMDVVPSRKETVRTAEMHPEMEEDLSVSAMTAVRVRIETEETTAENLLLRLLIWECANLAVMPAKIRTERKRRAARKR